jgi:hypothetical protein
MKKLWRIIVIGLMINLFIPCVAALTGFGPSEIYTDNHTMAIGKATLINGDDYDQYGIFKLFIPYVNKDTFQIVESEVIHARVICPNCGESCQRHNIYNYDYGDPLLGLCEKCGYALRFYTPVPRDELEYFSLEGAGNFILIPVDGEPLTWITDRQITAGGACTVNVVYNPSESYIKENMNQHWEMHLRGSTRTDKSGSTSFMIGGIDIRVLISFKFPLFIDAPSIVEKDKNFTAKVIYGPPSKAWSELPKDTYIVFNGISKQIDDEGKATFQVPDTRKDYEYTIEAVSDYYLSATKTVITGTPESDEGNILSDIIEFFSQNLLILIIVIAIIIAVIVACVWFIYFY